MKMIHIAALALGLMFAAGCGGDAKPTPAEAAPFVKAVQNYCKQKSFGMKVKEVKSLKITGDTATAACKMGDAEGLTNVSATWTFDFENQEDADGDKTWVATGHKR